MLFELLEIFLFFFIIKEIQILKQMISKNQIKSSINNDLFDNSFLNDFSNNFQKLFKNFENEVLREPLNKLPQKQLGVD